jgi:penicillin-binding protein 1A
VFVVLAGLAAGCGALPRLSDYRQHALPLAQTSFLYASDGSLITALHAGEDRVVLSRSQMPQSIRDAAVAIEDKRFYYHPGFDLILLGEALFALWNGGTLVLAVQTHSWSIALYAALFCVGLEFVLGMSLVQAWTVSRRLRLAVQGGAGHG